MADVADTEPNEPIPTVKDLASSGKPTFALVYGIFTLLKLCIYIIVPISAQPDTLF